MTKEIEAFCAECRKPCMLKTYRKETVRRKDAYVGKCPDCGNRVIVYKADVDYRNKPPRKCPKCKAEVPDKNKYCGTCGEEMPKR